MSVTSAEKKSPIAPTVETPRLKICILSRKPLTRITRIVRQAQALTRAGHQVTVIALQKPMDELVRTAPAVRWIEVEVEPRMSRKGRAEEPAVDGLPAVAAHQELNSSQRAPLRSVVRNAWRILGAPLVLLPTLVFIRERDEPALAFVRRYMKLGPLDFLRLYVYPLRQHANTSSFARSACEAVRGERFDICQAHDNYALVAAERLAKQSGGVVGYDAVEISEHRDEHLVAGGSLWGRITRRRERRVEERIIRKARYVVTIGDGLADWYSARYDIRRPVVVRNCREYWDYEPNDEIRGDCALSEDDVLVVWIGYAYPDQGLLALLETACLLEERFHFAIVADVLPRWAQFFAELGRNVQDAGLAGRIHFLSARDPIGLIPYIAGGDLGIIPRRRTSLNMEHSLPNKLFEMVMGRLPLAVSALPEMKALVERHALGRIFDAEDPRSIANSVREMVDPETYARLREHVHEAAKELCWEREAPKYLELVAEIACERAAAGDAS